MITSCPTVKVITTFPICQSDHTSQTSNAHSDTVLSMHNGPTRQQMDGQILLLSPKDSYSFPHNHPSFHCNSSLADDHTSPPQFSPHQFVFLETIIGLPKDDQFYPHN